MLHAAQMLTPDQHAPERAMVIPKMNTEDVAWSLDVPEYAVSPVVVLFGNHKSLTFVTLVGTPTSTALLTHPSLDT